MRVGGRHGLRNGYSVLDLTCMKTTIKFKTNRTIVDMVKRFYYVTRDTSLERYCIPWCNKQFEEQLFTY